MKGKRLKANTQRRYREALGSLARYSEDWPVSGEVVPGAGIHDLIGDMFPKVREGVAVRTLLKYEDLLLCERLWCGMLVIIGVVMMRSEQVSL